ncbi:MAG TPA: hypothetical protein VIH28_07020 [Ignavibacteriaceae bacterium]
MKITGEKVKEVTIGKDEAGLFLFKDTGISIEAGDKAFTIKEQNPFAGTMDTVYFKNRENAEKHI